MFFVVFFSSTIATLWIAHRWAIESFPPLARVRRGVAAVLVGLVISVFVTRWAALALHSPAANALQAVVVLLLMTIEIAAVPIGLLLGLAWARRRLAARKARTRSAPTSTSTSTSTTSPAATSVMGGALGRRQVVQGATGVALVGATGSMLAWGAVRGRHAFEVCEVAVPIPGLPRALDGYTIAQVSDLHAGQFVGERELDEGFALVRAMKPDLVVVTGDMVDFEASYAPLVARKLGDLPSRDGVTAILGNHDYYAGADAVTAALRAGGVDVLVNEGRVLRAGDGGGFALLGVDDRWSTRYGRSGPRLAPALRMVPPGLPRVLLSHQPATADYWAGQVALQLSGHTHGGQINPGFRPAALFLEYLAGRYAVGSTTLYVNRGFGTVGPPSRVGAPPEVTRVVLVSA